MGTAGIQAIISVVFKKDNHQTTPASPYLLLLIVVSHQKVVLLSRPTLKSLSIPSHERSFNGLSSSKIT